MYPLEVAVAWDINKAYTTALEGGYLVMFLKMQVYKAFINSSGSATRLTPLQAQRKITEYNQSRDKKIQVLM